MASVAVSERRMYPGISIAVPGSTKTSRRASASVNATSSSIGVRGRR